MYLNKSGNAPNFTSRNPACPRAGFSSAVLYKWLSHQRPMRGRISQFRFVMNSTNRPSARKQAAKTTEGGDEAVAGNVFEHGGRDHQVVVLPANRAGVELEHVALGHFHALDALRVEPLAEAVEHRRSEVEALHRPRRQAATQEGLAQGQCQAPVPQPASSTRSPERSSGDRQK